MVPVYAMHAAEVALAPQPGARERRTSAASTTAVRLPSSSPPADELDDGRDHGMPGLEPEMLQASPSDCF